MHALAPRSSTELICLLDMQRGARTHAADRRVRCAPGHASLMSELSCTEPLFPLPSLPAMVLLFVVPKSKLCLTREDGPGGRVKTANSYTAGG